ncbi:MAG: universal stress protein [Porticoccaceae bacterium]
MTFQTILHATDFSEASRPALDQARKLARFHQAKLHLLHVEVIPEVVYSTLDIAALGNAGEFTQSEPSGDRLKALVTAAEEDITLATVRHNRAAVAIADYAEHHGIDLIVVGSHGYSGIDRLLLGSEANKLLRIATAPVLVVRSGVVAKGDGSAPFSHLLAPVDLSDASMATLRKADKLAALYGASLRVIHAIDMIIPTHYAYVPAESQLPQAREALSGFISQAALAVDAEQVVLPGPAAMAILETAAKQGIDLIIMSRSGLSGWQRFLIGSTTERVLNKAECAVLVLPAAEKE